MGEDAAAQAAGALGLVHVVQGRPSICPQHVRHALAANAGLQNTEPTSAKRLLTTSLFFDMPGQVPPLSTT